jgi:hypothetical protein
MEKSKCLKMAEMAVLTNEVLEPFEKLEVLKVLIDREQTELYLEAQREKTEESEGENE